MKDQFAVAQDGTQIHFLDNAGTSPSLPLIVVPGMLGVAEHHQTEVTELAPRRVIALSNRGLGKSSKVSPGMFRKMARSFWKHAKASLLERNHRRLLGRRR